LVHVTGENKIAIYKTSVENIFNVERIVWMVKLQLFTPRRDINFITDN